eukprot:m.296406 g.296406  ORF g.296406 m.296406 type:complete len:248 (-) comp27192_c0_seq6:2753-3496(-)
MARRLTSDTLRWRLRLGRLFTNQTCGHMSTARVLNQPHTVRELGTPWSAAHRQQHSLTRATTTTPAYVQGEACGRRRLYFYWVDHNGFLFLDDTKHRNFTSCFKDPVFLKFFYSRIRLSEDSDPAADRFSSDFPWLSPCGPEINWIRADDTPIVFTALAQIPDSDPGASELSYAGGTITQPFDVTELEYCPDRGRLYHPEPRLAPNKALISSALTIEIAKSITFGDGGEAIITWGGEQHTLKPHKIA